MHGNYQVAYIGFLGDKIAMNSEMKLNEIKVTNGMEDRVTQYLFIILHDVMKGLKFNIFYFTYLFRLFYFIFLNFTGTKSPKVLSTFFNYILIKKK